MHIYLRIPGKEREKRMAQKIVTSAIFREIAAGYRYPHAQILEWVESGVVYEDGPMRCLDFVVHSRTGCSLLKMMKHNIQCQRQHLQGITPRLLKILQT